MWASAVSARPASLLLRFGESNPFPFFEGSPLIVSCGHEKMVSDDGQ